MPRLSRLALMVALICGAGSMMLADTSVTCAVNLAKGNISNSDISVQCGLSEEQVAEIRAGQQKTIEGIEGVQATSDEILALLVDQAKKTDDYARLRAAGITEEAIIELARRISKDVQDPAQAFKELERAAEVAIKVQQEGQATATPGDFVDEVLRRTAELAATGNYDAAAANIDAALAQEEAESQARTLRLLDAGIAQDILRRAPESAADRLVRKTELTLGEGQSLFQALRKVQDEYYVHGRDLGVNLDLAISIAIAGKCKAFATTADQRGAALIDLAISLQTLGEREGSADRLADAFTAFRAALREMTRDRVPLDWATTQNNLGIALLTLGMREGSAERVAEAVTAFRAALTERTQDRVPLDWAMTQNNLGNALLTLGERTGSAERLADAVTAYRAALEELTQDRVPLQWAKAQNNLGAALKTIGEWEGSPDRLAEAVAFYRAALEERTQDRVPLDWAGTQNNLGAALKTIGEWQGSTELLAEAATVYRAVLTERTQDRVPLQWAATQNDLGRVLHILGEWEGSTERLEQAVTVYHAALRERTQARVPLSWAATQNNLGRALQTLGELEGSADRLAEAVAFYRAALEERTRKRVPLDWAATQNNLGRALQTLAESEGRAEGLVQAVGAFQLALDERRRDRVPLDWALTQFNLSLVETTYFALTADPVHLDRAEAYVTSAREVFVQKEVAHFIAKADEQLADIVAKRP